MKVTSKDQSFDIVTQINKLSYSIIPQIIINNFSVKHTEDLTFIFSRNNIYHFAYNFIDRSFQFDIKVNRGYNGFIPASYKYTTPYEELALIKQSILEDIDLERARIKEAENYCLFSKKYLDEVTDEKVNEVLNEIKFLESKIK